MSEELKPKASLVLSLLTSLGLGGAGGTAISYYVQETQAKSIERLEIEHAVLEKLIYSELKEMNTRLSKIEGRLEPN